MDILYGVGEKRRLRPGEEAALIQAIDCIILDFIKNPELIKLPLTSNLNKKDLMFRGN